MESGALQCSAVCSLIRLCSDKLLCWRENARRADQRLWVRLICFFTTLLVRNVNFVIDKLVWLSWQPCPDRTRLVIYYFKQILLTDMEKVYLQSISPAQFQKALNADTDQDMSARDKVNQETTDVQHHYHSL